MPSYLNPSLADALVAGRHPDPFSWLGPHDTDDGRVVRTVQQHADNVWLVTRSGQATAMTRIHDGGLFEAPISPRLRRYSLRIESNGVVSETEDPYRFWSSIGELDLHLIGEGSHQLIFETLGAHPMRQGGVNGTRFAVWAPNAQRVSVIGGFNQWDGRRHVMRRHHDNGVWEIFIPGIGDGELYKFELLDALGHLLPAKADPYAHSSEPPPGNASIVCASRHRWRDQDWIKQHRGEPDLGQPVSIYEVHLGSWRRNENGNYLTYRELAEALVDYVRDLGFTHIELMPVSEHPFDGSWGYQPVGLYAPTHRFGSPDDFRYFVDRCHQAGLAVIVDWVPAHFPRDAHGLARFDGTALYEHEDPRRGEHADWGTLIFNYGRREVLNYLIGSALYWIESFHIDALRVDAVASMLYLDYSRDHGQWLANEFGGNENLEAVSFVRRLNEAVHARGAATFAEESTAWPGVSRPTYTGGLGFTYKWNMGWMNDTLAYMSEDPIHRRYHHDKLTFGLVYAFDENFVLPLSHDEVVHGKRSLIGRMPGDDWQRMANLRAYYAFMFLHPGKKLLFMGAELGQYHEWQHDAALDWPLLENASHAGLQRLVGELNEIYRTTPALHELDCEPGGFEWIDWQDGENSVLSWIRRDGHGGYRIAVANFTPVVRHEYRIGVPDKRRFRECFNSDAERFGGSGVVNGEDLDSEPVSHHGRDHSLSLTLPPLATIVLEPLENNK